MSEINIELKSGEFVYGVLDIFELEDSDDILSIGRLKGTIHVGDKIYITNRGDDDDEVIVTTVDAIEVDKLPASEANDGICSLRIREGKLENIKPGSVVCSENVDKNAIQMTYVNALGDSYIGKRKFELSEDDIMRMSITDLAETMRIFAWIFLKSDSKNKSKEEVDDFQRKCKIARESIAKKLMMADEIYCIVDNKTEEPHLFSQTVKKENGYINTPPEIKIFTKAYLNIAEHNFPKDKFTIVKVVNEDIESYLYDAFYLNGAAGVRIMFDTVTIPAYMIVEPRDYEKEKPKDFPITNPNLMRWMLLRGQIGVPETDDEKLIAGIYYRFLSIEMTKAQFIIPMKIEGEEPKLDSEGKLRLESDTKMKFPIKVGKDGKQLTFLFTDAKRLRAEYGNEWGGFVQTADKMLERFDLAINPSSKSNKGCFVDKEIFENMKKMAEENKPEK